MDSNPESELTTFHMWSCQTPQDYKPKLLFIDFAHSHQCLDPYCILRLLTCTSSIIFWTNASVCLCMAFSDSCFALSPSLILSCSSLHFCKKNVDAFSEAVDAYSLSVFVILFHLPFFVCGGILQNPEGFSEPPPPPQLRPCLLIRILYLKDPKASYM